MLIIGAGIYAARNAPKLVGWYFSTLEKQLDKITEPGVTAEQKGALREELDRFRTNLRSENVAEAQPVVMEIRRSIGDQRLSTEEVETLISRLREVNERMEKKPVTGSQ